MSNTPSSVAKRKGNERPEERHERGLKDLKKNVTNGGGGELKERRSGSQGRKSSKPKKRVMKERVGVTFMIGAPEGREIEIKERFHCLKGPCRWTL